MAAEPVYLDHNATSPPRPEALERALPLLTEHWGNPGSSHRLGRIPASAVEKARAEVAAWAGVRPRDVIFTSGATEANHLALLGLEARGGLLVSAVEHPSVLAPASRRGAQVLPVDAQGLLRLEALEEALEAPARQGVAPPGLVSVQAANNETGVMQPLERISALARRHGALLHVDAAQLPGRAPAPAAWDALTLTGHKGGGLKGVGALILREGLGLTPLQEGGGQERGRRAGTLNPAPVAALGAVLSLPAAPTGALRDLLEAGLLALGAVVTGAGAARLPNTCHVRFPGVEGQTLVAALDLEGVCCSAGSACASGAAQPSPVLEAMGLPPKEGLRLSLGWSTTASDIHRALEAVARVLEAHRQAEELWT